MLYVQPDFFDDFQCIAHECRHSCCVGWEIDIDGDSLSRFMSVQGEIGQSLKENIELSPTAHFVLDEAERCPFLRPDGLCRMILELGEDSLCHICREHPRFYNETDWRVEAGLGLCCEQAVRLLLGAEGHLRLEEFDDGEDEILDEPVILLRNRVYELLSQDQLPLPRRMEMVTELFGKALPVFDAKELSDLFLGLERMDAEWTKRLVRLKASEAAPDMGSMRYVRILEYFIYRHLISAQDTADAAARLGFCWLGTMLVAALDSIYADDESLRLFSAEIEYSDENVEKLIAYLK